MSTWPARPPHSASEIGLSARPLNRRDQPKRRDQRAGAGTGGAARGLMGIVSPALGMSFGSNGGLARGAPTPGVGPGPESSKGPLAVAN